MKGIIYKATNTYNGKVYIGQTVAGLATRKAQHYRDARADSNFFHLALYQFPNGFIWEVLDEFVGEREYVAHALNVAEEYQILKHKSNNESFGYNSTAGGYSSDKFSEHIQRRQKSLGGAAKQVLQYDANGEFVREFASLNEVSAHLNKERVRLKDITCGLHYGHQWRVKQNELYPTKIAPYKANTRRRGVKTVVYDENGDFYGVFDSASDAGVQTGTTNPNVRDEICDISVREHDARPFYFFKYEENCPKKIEIEITKKKEKKRGEPTVSVPVLAYDAVTGLFVAEYPSIREAHNTTGVATQTIAYYIRMQQPFAVNSPKTKFVWMRKTEEIAPSVKVAPFMVKPKREKKMEHRIIQYTLDGEFVKVWDNAYQAAVAGADGAHIIRKCLTGEFKSPKLNYQWVFYTTDYPQNIGKFAPDNYGGRSAGRRTRMDDTIEEVSYDGTVIATYRDTADAAEKSGFSQAYICNVLAGRIKHPKRRFRRK